MAKIHAGREPTYSAAADLELAPRAPGPVPVPSPAPGPDTDYGARTVVELRQLLRERNTGRSETDQLPLSGNKPDLIRRLQDDDA